MNLFELFVKIGVDDKASGALKSIGSKLGNGLKTAAKIGTAAVGAAAAGITALTKSAVENYAEYEQLVGGVETLFKDSADKVQEYAANAYKTAGMSANEYMSTATSFSASLLQSLVGDTEKAAEYANQALTDMSDNANKMGTSMEMIQNAYQGFAKQNYTMLDNLKLGYGGTKEEMARLIEDAAKLSDTVDAQDMSFANIVKAINVVQTEMGITGTTAMEAASTIEGSLSMMKASWQNLVVGMADDTQDFDVLLDNFVDSTTTVADNIMPRIATTLNGIGKLVEGVAPAIAEALPTLVADLLPSIVGAAVGLLQSFGSALIENGPTLIQSILDSIFTILTEGIGMSDSVAGGIVGIFEQAFSGIGSIVSSLWDVVEAVFGALSEAASSLGITWDDVFSAIGSVINFVVEAWSVAADLIVKAIDFLVSEAQTEGTFVNELISGIIGVVSSLWELCVSAFEAISTAFSWMVEQAGTDGTVLNSVWNGLKAVASTVWETIKTVIIAAIDVIKGVLNVFTSVLRGDWSAAWNGIKEIASTVWEAIVSIFDSIVETASNGIAPLVDIGSEIVNKIKDGIASKWNELVSWFNGIWDSLFGGRSVDVSVNGSGGVAVDGSHAGGLSYVPYDGYIAELHKGERVLTAKEAAWYNNQRPSVNVVQNIYSEAKTASDLMQEALYQQERAVLLGV